MKLKYYLRGLGIGILVTALVMGATSGKDLTEEEIRAKALQLGMVEVPETNVLSDLQANVNDESKANNPVEESIPVMETVESTEELETVESEEAVKVTESTTETQENAKETQESPKETQESTEAVKETVEATQESTETQPTESMVSENTGEKVTITVHGGDSSVAVSNALVAAGLVADAKEYDRYLCSNGYDKRICVGTYEIEMGSDYETIAKIITKR